MIESYEYLMFGKKQELPLPLVCHLNNIEKKKKIDFLLRLLDIRPLAFICINYILLTLPNIQLFGIHISCTQHTISIHVRVHKWYIYTCILKCAYICVNKKEIHECRPSFFFFHVWKVEDHCQPNCGYASVPSAFSKAFY